MKNQKTRCRYCFYFDKKAIEEPCKECNEIQEKYYGYDNHFLVKDKDLFQKLEREE